MFFHDIVHQLCAKGLEKECSVESRGYVKGVPLLNTRVYETGIFSVQTVHIKPFRVPLSPGEGHRTSPQYLWVWIQQSFMR